jgi:hypothetical protein
MGDIIAKCGNSGYSPEPHIHIQVQMYGVLGSRTLPFKFIDYINNGKLYYYSLPKKNEIIEATLTDKSMKLRLNFILDDKFEYEVFKNDKKVDNLKIEVKMNDKGEFYFYDGRNKLYFYTDEKLFYFYEYEGNDSYLKELFKLAPKIPLISKEIEYTDILPPQFIYSLIKKTIIEFLLPFNFNLFLKKENYYKEKLKIKSRFGEIDFSFYEKGFERIKFKESELRRINEKNNTAN